MSCNGNCPYQRPYYGPSYPITQPIPMVSQPRPDESPVEYFKRAKRELKEMEEAFRTEKKDGDKDKPKKKDTFTFLETFGLLLIGGPIVAILQMKLIAYVLSSVPH